MKRLSVNNYEDEPDGRPKLDYCLDCWAYFLDRYTDTIESIPSKTSDESREVEKEWLRRCFDRGVKMEIAQMALSSARLMQLGHTYMKLAVKRGDKYKDVRYKTEAISAYQKTQVQSPGDPFAKYY